MARYSIFVLKVPLNTKQLTDFNSIYLLWLFVLQLCRKL